jgi:hypothetical protein
MPQRYAGEKKRLIDKLRLRPNNSLNATVMYRGDNPAPRGARKLKR